MQALAHPFFDDLREPTARLPCGRSLPNLFNFTDAGELAATAFACHSSPSVCDHFAEYRTMVERKLTRKLLPSHVLSRAVAANKVPTPIAAVPVAIRDSAADSKDAPSQSSSTAQDEAVAGGVPPIDAEEP